MSDMKPSRSSYHPYTYGVKPVVSGQLIKPGPAAPGDDSDTEGTVRSPETVLSPEGTVRGQKGTVRGQEGTVSGQEGTVHSP